MGLGVGVRDIVYVIVGVVMGMLGLADAVLEAGHRVFVLHAADGSPILLTDSLESAMADAASNQLETVSVH